MPLFFNVIWHIPQYNAMNYLFHFRYFFVEKRPQWIDSHIFQTYSIIESFLKKIKEVYDREGLHFLVHYFFINFLILFLGPSLVSNSAPLLTQQTVLRKKVTENSIAQYLFIFFVVKLLFYSSPLWILYKKGQRDNLDLKFVHFFNLDLDIFFGAKWTSNFKKIFKLDLKYKYFLNLNHNVFFNRK